MFLFIFIPKQYANFNTKNRSDKKKNGALEYYTVHNIKILLLRHLKSYKIIKIFKYHKNVNYYIYPNGVKLNFDNFIN